MPYAPCPMLFYLPQNRVHRESGVALLRKKRKDFLFGDSDRFIRNHFDEIRNADLLRQSDQSIPDLVLDLFGHLNKPFRPDFTDQPLSLRDIIFAVTDEAGCDLSPSHGTREGGELHPAGSHPREVAVDSHHTVAHRENSRYTFTAPAGGHRIVHQAIEVVVVDLLTGSFIDKLVYAFPLPQVHIDDFSLWNGLVWSGGIDLEGSFAIHPVVSAAQACSFRADDADMAGGKGLAKGAGVEGVYGLVGHPFDAFIPLLVDLPCLCKNLIHLLLIGVDLHLGFIEDGSEVLVKLRMKDFPQMGKTESFIHSPFANP